MNSEIPPGAGAAGLITADFGDDFSSMFPTSITIDPVVAFPPFGDVPLMGTMSSTVPQQLSSPLHAPMDPQENINLLHISNLNTGTNQLQQQMPPNMNMQNMGVNIGQMQQQQQFIVQQQQYQQQQQQIHMGGMQNNILSNPQQQLNGAMSGMMTGGMNMYGGRIQGQMGQIQGQMQGQMQGQANRLMPPPVVVEDHSEPKVILRAEMGGGLNVSLVFRYGAQAIAYMGAHCVFLIVQNTKDYPIR